MTNLLAAWLVAQARPRRLTRRQRARLFSAFLTLLSLSVVGMLVVWALLRVARRKLRHDAEPPEIDADDWVRQQLQDDSIDDDDAS